MAAIGSGRVECNAVNEIWMGVVFEVGSTVRKLAALRFGKEQLGLVAECVFRVIRLRCCQHQIISPQHYAPRRGRRCPIQCARRLFPGTEYSRISWDQSGTTEASR